MGTQHHHSLLTKFLADPMVAHEDSKTIQAFLIRLHRVWIQTDHVFWVKMK